MDEELSFQFTHPGKGATDLLLSHVERFLVSIHAPWEGCDHQMAEALNEPLEFQFTHPGKGATFVTLKFADDYPQFQFTHPGKGATRPCPQLDRRGEVSIHAPWEGCDLLPR